MNKARYQGLTSLVSHQMRMIDMIQTVWLFHVVGDELRNLFQEWTTNLDHFRHQLSKQSINALMSCTEKKIIISYNISAKGQGIQMLNFRCSESATHIIGLVKPVGKWTHCLIRYYSVSLSRRNIIGGCIEGIILVRAKGESLERPENVSRLWVNIMCKRGE